ncbi:hypothetical protein HU200_004500 [Digitaria exilis]|uniref:U-box domain-containing protein n=1 Tax=Digitaria exilis TaxID=1010633 RepID=A0A835FW27_9POAL|nr:hypothetical protein HU200_004500 [Digitaria exilis]
MAAGGYGVAQQAELRRIEGNACFKKARLGAAIDCYTEASIPHFPSPRPSFIPPWLYKANRLDATSLAVASNSERFLSDESLIGNRALPRCSRLLDQSGTMPFQAQVGNFDPVTREPLKEHQLVPNLAIKEAVQAYLKEHAGPTAELVRCLLTMLNC